MGMFDNVILDVNILPDLSEWELNILRNKPYHDNWQTKSFVNELTNIYIVEDKENKYKHSFLGDKTSYKLQIKNYDWETTPKEERPYPDAEEGSLESLIGCMRETNIEIIDINFNGNFTFYTYIKKDGELTWLEYLCETENGKIISIKRLTEQE